MAIEIFEINIMTTVAMVDLVIREVQRGGMAKGLARDSYQCRTPTHSPEFAIMSGAGLGGVLLDHFSFAATLIGGTALLLFASMTVGNDGIRPSPMQ